MTPDNTSTENLTEEQARAILEEATGKLQQQLAKADQQLGTWIQGFEEQRQSVSAEIDELRAELVQLTPYKDSAGALHYQRLFALLESRRAFATTLEVELACARANQDLARAGMPPEWDGETDLIKYANQDLRYREARVTMDYYLAGFYWLSELEAVDALLRAVGAEPAIVSANEDEEARRQANAENLKRLLDGDDALKVSLARVLEDLQVTQVLLPWAKGALRRLADLGAEEKRNILADTDWAKLNGVIGTLHDLPETLKRHPQLADFPFAVPMDGGAAAVS
ncbi:MAG TPA: hypothetical protein V6D47_14420 [Oscillatoriaceae cyanobacterium]